LQCYLIPKTIILPRQARDKHRESTQKERCRRFISHLLLLRTGRLGKQLLAAGGK
jgi:hypothetical protein